MSAGSRFGSDREVADAAARSEQLVPRLLLGREVANHRPHDRADVDRSEPQLRRFLAHDAAELRARLDPHRVSFRLQISIAGAAYSRAGEKRVTHRLSLRHR